MTARRPVGGFKILLLGWVEMMMSAFAICLALALLTYLECTQTSTNLNLTQHPVAYLATLHIVQCHLSLSYTACCVALELM